MDGLALLREARGAGLSVAAEGDRLRVRGPKSAGDVAARLLADKAAVLAALADEEWQPQVRAAYSPERHPTPAGCFARLACSRLGPCERHARGEPCEGGVQGNALVMNGAPLDCVGKLPAKPDIEGTARNIAALTPDELVAYRAELASPPDDDPNLAHDRAALALAVARGWVTP